MGLARALAKNPEERARRRAIVTKPLEVSSVGEAVIAASELYDKAKEQADARTLERDTAERAELMRSLGVDEDESMDMKQRNQVRTMVKQMEEEQKRRAKRAMTDQLDRAMIDLLSLHRDILSIQLGTGVELVNTDLAERITAIARSTTAESTLARIDSIEEARRRLQTNAMPQLVLESLLIELLTAA